MKLIRLFAGLSAFGFLIAVMLIGAGFLYLSQEFKKPGPLHEPSIFMVSRGEGLNRIADNLHQRNYIQTPLVFKLGTRMAGAQGDLKAGEYQLTPAMSAKDIMQLFRDGRTFQRQITIREGLTSYEIVHIINETDNLTGTLVDIPLEGVLLPNTYNYHLDEERTTLIQRLEANMRSTLAELCGVSAEDLPFTTFLEKPCGFPPLQNIRDVLTLASIVEKETGIAGERRRVAGVFMNRLKRGIPLQTDPTVIYALTAGKHDNNGQGPLGRRLLRKDLKFDSPYNTYKYAGLPPGPIANPGRESLEAVLSPEDHDYIYFVADGTGGHAFAKTLDEHNRNAAQWRKIRRSQP